MEYIYRRYNSAFCFVPGIIVILVIVTIIAIIILRAWRKKKEQQNDWFAPLFTLILPTILLVNTIHCIAFEKETYNKFTKEEYFSVNGPLYIISVEYNRADEIFCSFYVNNYLFDDIYGEEGEIISKIEKGTIVEVHFVLDENKPFEDEKLVILEIIKIE